MENQNLQSQQIDVTQSMTTSSSQVSSSVINTQPIPPAGHSKYVLPPDAVNMELRRKLWEGLLPVKVDLALSDLNSMETPRSLYIMAPRENYFFYILNEVKSLFDQYAPSDKIDAYDEMWFEFNNAPLKWNVPIGVQFDTFVGVKDKQKDLPWCLIFHYRGFPEEQVLRLEGINFYRFHFINALKESQNLRTGSASELLSHMSKKDETRMIDGMLKHNFEGFWEINQPLCDKHIAELKKYALRIFCNRHHTYLQPNIDVNSSHGEEGQWEEQAQQVTLGDVLADVFPRLFDKTLNDSGDIEIQKKKNFEIVVQGVEAEMKTPLYWMQLNMSYLDNFLYIVFHFK